MVFDNFDVVMQWNRSQNYALAVAQLAGQISGLDGLQSPAGEGGALSVAQVKSLQQSLNQLGFDVGEPDGLLGPRTQSAVRRYQVVHALPADGYPSPSLVADVERTLAQADSQPRLTLAPSVGARDERP
jgi:membrane-bound lytic murein transglycosylase B